MTSLILQTAGRSLFHTLLVFSVYLLFAGHNRPGGGFIGGLVAGGALVLRYVAEGPDELLRTVPGRPPALLGSGIGCAALAGVLGLAAGQPFLTGGKLSATLPLLGELKVTTVLLFDAGVYLIVVGMVFAILQSLGGELGGETEA